ncbi:nicotinamidase [Adelges cooleyi]|uniref:nicotinamidase n=1 Tax=Adelges cooleyi TaxID=133065 RepID=UPI00217F6AC6|nr:nicotinamidase [Adelges cooleyi]XP_050439326.1 nicotinamidase [Adelges cooleyi]
MDACFSAFDDDGDGFLNIHEFDSICKGLFRNDRGIVYSLDADRLEHIFSIFDTKKDGLIDRQEFVLCWDKWIKTIVRPVSVFLIIDVQNDFISGTLNISNCSAQQNGLEVIEPINQLLDTVNFDSVFYSYDWHPTDHISFIENLSLRKLDSSSPVSAEDAKPFDTVVFEGCPKIKQRLWPKHCIQDSWGAQLYKDLKVVDNAMKIYKGTVSDVDSYSVFWDNKKLSETTLCNQLANLNITDIYVCGLAYDVCVGATAADALSIGYRTILIDDCCRGVDVDDINLTKNSVIKNHGVIVQSHEVKAMVEGRDRRPELGYKLALELEKSIQNSKVKHIK